MTNQRRLILLGIGLVTMLLVGTAYAATAPSRAHGKAGAVRSGVGALNVSEVSGTSDETGSRGVHGGSVSRVHEGCDLPTGVTLAGNWTHGDFVSAWAALDPSMVPDAAHADCGKPVASTQHGQGHGPKGGAGPTSRGHSATAPGHLKHPSS